MTINPVSRFNFKNIKIPVHIVSTPSITLHRVGRDKLNFINFASFNIKDNDDVEYNESIEQQYLV